MMGSVNKLSKRSSIENNRWRCTMDDGVEKMQYSSIGNSRKGTGKECCMCGDLGFQESLFRCNRCHHRFQHIYCSRLYSDQLELDGVNVCDWCLDIQGKEKIQNHKRKLELEEMGSGKSQEVAGSETVSKSASTSILKRPAALNIENPRKVNANQATVNLHPKLGWSKRKQRLNLREDCNLSTESSTNLHGSSTQRNTTKSGLGRRYKLLSDVLYP